MSEGAKELKIFRAIAQKFFPDNIDEDMEVINWVDNAEWAIETDSGYEFGTQPMDIDELYLVDISK
ncbi:16256_t:CDS:2 [Dentiscutata heterogama]|uniref:16256_t:CDS:1 n=1 Tax=Dentiscutata heterogama TaxID=1316150 RepID=A0ACA9L532_9GLOM|nr:16256_t:CDS:2 [Dentiscutata heterogama]